MAIMKNSDLLKDERVKKEIEQHKWFESEKAGHDIGFEKASETWLKKYSKQWMKQNLPAVSAKKKTAKKR